MSVENALSSGSEQAGSIKFILKENSQIISRINLFP